MALDDCAPCDCDPGQLSRTTEIYRMSVVRILCGILTAISGGQGPWEVGAAALARSAATGAGSVTAGAYSVTIANVGNANGTVLGVAILPGQVLNFNAVENPVTRVFELLPAIAYDGTGTTLHLTVETT